MNDHSARCAIYDGDGDRCDCGFALRKQARPVSTPAGPEDLKIYQSIAQNYRAGVALADPLTKRELFAAMALQGLLADPNCGGKAAETAVYYADQLIKELEKPRG